MKYLSLSIFHDVTRDQHFKMTTKLLNFLAQPSKSQPSLVPTDIHDKDEDLLSLAYIIKQFY